MKRIAIVYNQSLRQIQGINFVNNAFVQGQKYFNQNGFELKSIFSPLEVFECRNKNYLDLIGSNLTTKSYKRERKLRSFLRMSLSSKFLFGASVKLYFNHIRNAHVSVQKLLGRHHEFNYLIFQDLTTAGYYLKKTSAGERKKSIIILHCYKEPYEQMRPIFPAIFRNRIWTKWINDNMDMVFKNIDKVVYLSQRAVDYSLVPLNKKTFIFNGVEDIEDHNFVDIHNPINCVSVGSMAWRKGQDYVIEAMSKLPERTRNRLKYHLIGAGPQMQELKDAVDRYNLSDKVIFYGNRNDVPELLKEMDVFILPSKNEGLPISIIEALRQGMYLIATDTGAIPDMIAPGCGELVERDIDMIAECLERLVDENRVTMDVKKQAREHYLEHFTLKNMIYNYCEVLKSL